PSGVERGPEKAVLNNRAGGRLGGRDGGTTTDQHGAAGRTAVPAHGTLRHAGRDGFAVDDAVVDLDQWIASEVEAAFAEQEGAAFVSGDGVSKPQGFLSYTAVAEASWAWGKIGYILTGVSGALPTSSPSDILIDTIYAL